MRFLVIIMITYMYVYVYLTKGYKNLNNAYSTQIIFTAYIELHVIDASCDHITIHLARLVITETHTFCLHSANE